MLCACAWYEQVERPEDKKNRWKIHQMFLWKSLRKLRDFWVLNNMHHYNLTVRWRRYLNAIFNYTYLYKKMKHICQKIMSWGKQQFVQKQNELCAFQSLKRQIWLKKFKTLMIYATSFHYRNFRRHAPNPIDRSSFKLSRITLRYVTLSSGVRWDQTCS